MGTFQSCTGENTWLFTLCAASHLLARIYISTASLAKLARKKNFSASMYCLADSKWRASPWWNGSATCWRKAVSVRFLQHEWRISSLVSQPRHEPRMSPVLSPGHTWNQFASQRIWDFVIFVLWGISSTVNLVSETVIRQPLTSESWASTIWTALVHCREAIADSMALWLQPASIKWLIAVSTCPPIFLG